MRRLAPLILRVPLALIAVAVGLLSAEGLTRVLVPMEIMLETWFTPGVHTYDAEMGFVFTPGYQGMMRHADGLWVGEPVRLDEHGYRLVALPPERTEATQKIVILGGRSLMMSYGLPDEATIHHRLAAHLDKPTEVLNTAWAGDSLWRAWHFFNREVAREEPYDLAIIALVSPYLRPFVGRSDYTLPSDGRPEEAIFPYLDGVMLWRGPLFAKYPRTSHSSYLGFALFRRAEQAMKEWRKRWRPKPGNRKITGTPEEITGYIDFLGHIRDELAARGTKTVFVTMPHGEPIDYYEALTSAFPSDFSWVDLHAEMRETLPLEQFFAQGHYRAPLADRIAERLAEAVEAELDPEQNQPAR